MQLGTFTRALLCGTTLISMSAPLHAEQATQLDLITVTVNKIKQVLSEVAGGVSVGTKADKDLYGQNTVADVLRPMPGVAVNQTANEPAQGVNIRGLQDFGRVNVTIDGARQNYQRTGHNSNGMFYFEPEHLQQVTVTRGPIANVYGSGAIGGVVSFDTQDALTFLKPNEQIAGQEKLSYSTNGGNVLSSTTGAVRFGDYGGALGNFVYRNNGTFVDGDGNAVKNSAREIVAGSGKVTFTPGADTRIDLGLIMDDFQFKSTPTPTSATTHQNDVKAQTFSSKLQWNPHDNDLINLTASAYYTSTRQDQTNIVSKAKRFFEIRTIGTDIYNTSKFNTGGLKHELTFGGDVFRDDVSVVDPSVFSAAYFYTPNGSRVVGGAFIQDKVEVNRWLEAIVAGRYDAYSLSGKVSNGAVPPVYSPFGTGGSQFSPKGTLVFKPFEDTALKGLNLYATYAEGYRAPSVTETMVSGQHPGGFGFEFLPNPNLRPETAHNLEAGFTGKFNNVFTTDDAVSVRGSIYKNRVTDYIDGVWNGAQTQYQYVNIGTAELWGLEGEINYDSPVFFGGLAGSMVRGDNVNAGQPLLNIPQDKLVTTLGFHFADRKGSLGARWVAAAAQTRVPAAVPANPTGAAYNLVNLFAAYAVNDNLNFGVNVDNLFNTDYRVFGDGTDSPGRSVMLTVTTRFGK